MGKNTERMERMERMTGILRKMRSSFRASCGKNEVSKYKCLSVLSYLSWGGVGVMYLESFLLPPPLAREGKERMRRHKKALSGPTLKASTKTT
jgi:hypothetical protein